MNGRSLMFTPVDGQPIPIEQIQLVEIDEAENHPPNRPWDAERDGPSVRFEGSQITPESSRDDDVAGYPFVLADGRIWHLARPALRIRPKFSGETGKVELENFWDYPAKVRAKVEALMAAVSSAADEVPLDLIVDAAFALVRLCHRIEPEHAASLFELSIREVEDIAVGMVRMFRGFSPVESTQDEPVEPTRVE